MTALTLSNYLENIHNYADKKSFKNSQTRSTAHNKNILSDNDFSSYNLHTPTLSHVVSVNIHALVVTQP